MGEKDNNTTPAAMISIVTVIVRFLQFFKFLAQQKGGNPDATQKRIPPRLPFYLWMEPNLYQPLAMLMWMGLFWSSFIGRQLPRAAMLSSVWCIFAGNIKLFSCRADGANNHISMKVDIIQVVIDDNNRKRLSVHSSNRGKESIVCMAATPFTIRKSCT